MLISLHLFNSFGMRLCQNFNDVDHGNQIDKCRKMRHFSKQSLSHSKKVLCNRVRSTDWKSNENTLFKVSNSQLNKC